MPDVIFSTYATDSAAADESQSKTGISVVVISYSELGFGMTDIFGELVQESLKLIGQVTGQVERAQEVVGFFNLVCKTFNDKYPSSTREVYDEATRLNDLADQVRKAHLDRMKAGTCNALPALTFSDMAVALRRIKNHTVNLHEALLSEHVQTA